MDDNNVYFFLLVFAVAKHYVYSTDPISLGEGLQNLWTKQLTDHISSVTFQDILLRKGISYRGHEYYLSLIDKFISNYEFYLPEGIKLNPQSMTDLMLRDFIYCIEQNEPIAKCKFCDWISDIIFGVLISMFMGVFMGFCGYEPPQRDVEAVTFLMEIIKKIFG